VRSVAPAPAHAHGQGIVRRDIKPEHVLPSSGTAVVTELHLAMALAASGTPAPRGTITQIGTSLRTTAYLAPDQASGGRGMVGSSTITSVRKARSATRPGASSPLRSLERYRENSFPHVAGCGIGGTPISTPEVHQFLKVMVPITPLNGEAPASPSIVTPFLPPDPPMFREFAT
jgi:serine/threonine protein kinase